MLQKSITIRHDFATIVIKPKRSLPDEMVEGVKGLLDKYATEEWFSGDSLIKELKSKFKNHDTAGFKVRAFRLRKDMTQQGLAKKAKLSQADLSKIENGKLNPGVAMAKKLAAVLGCDYHQLI
jgi:DNA-binding XRE family transcriptional regulator